MDEKHRSNGTQWGKVLLYSTAILTLYMGTSEANFEQQLEKASTLTLDKISAFVLGGAAIIGGGMQAKDGNIMKGAAVVAVAAMIGITVALIKGDVFFKALQ